MILDVKFKEKFCLSDRQIQLRTLCPADVQDRYLHWMMDTEVNQYAEWRFYPQSLQELRSYAERAWNDENVLLCAIRLVESNYHIGNIKLTADLHHRKADIGIVLGEKDCWGKGYGSAAIKLLADFAFNVLALRKLYAGAYSSNLGSIRAFEKAEFKIEARMERHFLTAEGEVDGIYLARFAK